MKKRNIYITILASIILFGYAYNLDILQALQGPFREPPFNFTSTQFNLLYFFTFLPTVFLDIPIGIIIDKSPLKVSMYTLLIISLFSQICIALVLQFMVSNYLWVMYGMRSLFGIAGEGMFTVQNVIVAKYAKSDYQIMMGVCLSLPFLMDSFNSAITTAVYDATGYMPLPWYIGSVICLLSLFTAMILHKKYLRSKQNKWAAQKIKNKLQEQSTSSEELVQQQFNFKAIKTFKFQFWVLIGTILFTQASLGPFVDNLNDLIVKRFNISYPTAGKLLLIPFGFLTPISLAITILLSKKPNLRRNLILISSVLYFLAMSFLYFLPNTNSPAFYYYLVISFFLLMMSLLFSTYYSIVVSSIAYVVKQEHLGTAFGICGCAIGLSQCIVPIGNMLIMSQASGIVHQYENLNLLGLILSFIPIIFSIWIKSDRFKVLDHNLSQQNRRKRSQQVGINDQIDKDQIEKGQIEKGQIEKDQIERGQIDAKNQLNQSLLSNN